MKAMFECHDCASELIIIDSTQELEADDITTCPICGSNNIIVSVSNK